MTVAYTIKAHPTLYGGVMFRSRLEATWAAFFDLLGWSWEYEPFDLGTWSPDFLIRGHNKDCLVEVKPTTSPDWNTVNKVFRFSEDHIVLMCGVAPHINTTIAHLDVLALRDNKTGWRSAMFSKRHTGGLDIIDRCSSNFGIVTGELFGDPCENDMVGGEVRSLWNQAKNVNQWRPRR